MHFRRGPKTTCGAAQPTRTSRAETVHEEPERAHMSSHSRHVWARAGALLTTAALLATGMFAIAPPSVAAVSTSVVISPVYGGGGNSGATSVSYTHLRAH